MIAKGKNGSDYHTVTGVNTNGVDVLHTADGDSVVGGVTHNLELDLLVASNALLYENLANGRRIKRANRKLAKLLFVIGKATASTAEGKRGAKNYGVADLFRNGNGLLNGVGYVGGDNRLTDGLTKLLEQLSVLCSLDTLEGGSKKLNAALFKDTLLLKEHCHIKTGLSADTGNDSVGALVSDYLRDVFKGQGLHIYLVRNGGVGHYRCGVGVYEDYLIALLLQRKTRLRTCVIELCRLTDNDRTGADYHDSFDVCSLCHFSISSNNFNLS